MEAPLPPATTHVKSSSHIEGIQELTPHGLYLPWLVLLVSLFATFQVWKFRERAFDLNAQSYFALRTHDTVDRINNRLRRYEQILEGTRALFKATGLPQRETFRNYVASLNLKARYPGMQSIGFSLLVPPAPQNHHAQGSPRQNLPALPPHSAYSSILYLESLAPQEPSALGDDMHAESVHRNAMDMAEDSGQPTLTRLLRLDRQPQPTPSTGFLIYLPIYWTDLPPGTPAERRAHFAGWIFAEIRMNELMQGLTGSVAEDLSLRVNDGEDSDPASLLYQSSEPLLAHSPLYYQTALPLFGRQWTLRMGSRPSAASLLNPTHPLWTGLSGIAVSCLLSLITWMTLNGRRRAVQLARKLNEDLILNTEALRRENEKTLVLLHNASDGIHILDHEGNLVEASNSFCDMLGYSRDEIIGMNVAVWDAGFSDPEQLKHAIKRQFDIPSRSEFETRHRKKDGTIFDVEISGQPLMLQGEPRLFNSSRDISERKQLQKSLDRERDFTDAILQSAVPLIMVLDQQWSIVRLNRSAENFTGYSLEEASQTPGFWLRFLLPEQRREVESLIHAALEGSPDPSHEYDWVNRRGERRLFRWTHAPVQNDRESKRYLVIIGTDITEEKANLQLIEEERQRLHTILDNLGEGIYMLDLQGRLTYLNDEAERILGWTQAELAGQNIHDIIHHHTPDGQPLALEQCPIFEAMATNSIYRSADEMFFHKDGSQLPVKLTGAPINSDGKLVGSVAVFSCIRDEKLRQQRLVEAKNAAEQAARMKSDFLSTMSHEIRTPLNGVIGMIDLLQDTPLDVNQAEFARTAKISADALLSIINDILDYSKIEAGKLVIEHIPFSVTALVEESLKIMSRRAAEKGLELHHHIDASIPSQLQGDPNRIRQILLNFLSNAIKFTPRGQISLHVVHEHPVDTQPWLIRFEVRDTGIGLAEDVRQKLFRPFTQADSSTTRRYGGTGLGLAISKQLAENMGGTIGVDSLPEQGSTFWISLPFKSAHASLEVQAPNRPIPAETATSSLSPPDLPKLPVLLAEDNAINQKVTVHMLTKLGYSVDVVNNGEEVIRANEQKFYGLILMDCHMPILDGYEAALKIRSMQQPDAPRVPIIALTASAMDGDKAKCLEAGMDDYLIKPVDLLQLEKALARWIAHPTALANAVPPSAHTEDAMVHLDIAHLESLFDHDQAVVIELLQLFHDSTLSLQQTLDQALPSHSEQALKSLHELSGVASNIGAFALANLAKNMEQGCKHNDWPLVEALAHELYPELVNTRLAAMQHIQNLQSDAAH